MKKINLEGRRRPSAKFRGLGRANCKQKLGKQTVECHHGLMEASHAIGQRKQTAAGLL